MNTSRPRSSPLLWIALIVLFTSAVSAQVALDGVFPRASIREVQWVRSTELMRRLTLGHNAIWADIYWIRAVQYYGSTKLSQEQTKDYSLLYPLLDITTTLDPRFNIAYRFGAILLSEGYPNGPGNTEQAVALLEKAMREMPDKWQYLHDAGFVDYWWNRDVKSAARWFREAAKKPGAPNWLEPLAASVLAEGGDYDTARGLWAEMLVTSDQEWLKAAARRGLMQIDAEKHIELLQPIVNEYYDRHGAFPASWMDLVKEGRLRRVPVDPSSHVYALDPVSGTVDVDKKSTLFPMRGRGRGR